MEPFAFLHGFIGPTDNNQSHLRSQKQERSNRSFRVPATVLEIAGYAIAVSVLASLNLYVMVRPANPVSDEPNQKPLVDSQLGSMGDELGAATSATISAATEVLTAQPKFQLTDLGAYNSKASHNRAASVAAPTAFTTSTRSTISSPTAPLQATRIVLKRSERIVYVYQGEQELARFPVAVGKPGWETPLGAFHVSSMVKNPGWTHPFTGEIMPPGSNNPLGERWIEFWTDGTNSIGFHGTSNRASVGQAASHGCVRMYNEDIEQMYQWVSEHTPVIVQP